MLSPHPQYSLPPTKTASLSWKWMDLNLPLEQSSGNETLPIQRNCMQLDITPQPCPLPKETTKSSTENSWELYTLFVTGHTSSEKPPYLSLFGQTTKTSPIGASPTKLALMWQHGKSNFSNITMNSNTNQEKP